ncbi:MAG: AI-2E family transporter [Actinomycetota bacterium]|jgi:predicted PurR-regulated permease PerM|nr:AI-2E family transporter [Actinomycetota bacterium]
MTSPELTYGRWRRLLVSSWALIGLTILIIAVFWALGRVSTALAPFILAAVLVFIMRGLVNWIQSRGVSRGLAVGIAYLVAAAGLVVAGLFVIPPLAEQVRQFVIAAPAYFDRAQEIWVDVQTSYQAVTLPDWLLEASQQANDAISSHLVEWSSRMASSVFFAGGAIVNFLFNGVLALVIAYYVLRDLPVIREELLSLSGPARRDEARMIWTKISTVLGGYLRGQLIIAAIVGTLIAVGLWFLGVPYALVIGLIAGVFNIVPYLGPIVGYIVGGISAAFVDPWLALWTVGWIVVVQQIDNLFVSPRVLSKQVDLHPILVIFSLLVGASLMGLTGMLVAIPIAAVGKGLFVYYFEKNTSSELASSGGALFRRAEAATPQSSSEVDLGIEQNGIESLAVDTADETSDAPDQG